MKKEIFTFFQVLTIAIAVLLIMSHPVLAKPNYTLTDLGVSGFDSIAYGINEYGQVVGWSGDQAVLWENGSITILGLGYATDINEFGQIVGGQSGAVLWENGVTNNLEAPGGHRSWSSGINNLEQVSIYSPTADEDSAPYHAYVWDPVNGIIDLDTTGYSFAYDVNDNEIVVGRFGSPASCPAIWQNGVMTQIGTSSGQAHAINNFNKVVGFYNRQAFLWDGSNITNLGNLGADISEAWAINDQDQVVGKLYYNMSTPQQYERAFLWQDEQMYNLNDLVDGNSGCILTSAYDINNKGQIVGVCEINGERRAFLLTPVPEDSDGDEIPDNEDDCPDSNLSETVIIDGWDSGVLNALLEDGCTISDLISKCADDADNHGEFVSAVSHTTNYLKKDGIISGKDKGMIQKGAATADIP